MQRTLTSLFTRSLVQRSSVPSTGASFAIARQLHAGSKLANEFADNGSRGGRRGPPERLPNGVFVGGLSHEMGEEDLKRVFGQIGEVKSANVVFDRDTQRSKRFGFVYFADAEPVNTVISDPSLISELGPTTGVSKLEDGPRKRSPAATQGGRADPSNSVFITGFAPSMSKAEIESEVSQFYPESGVIDEVVLPLNRIERMEEDEDFAEQQQQDEPRRNKGYAFVKFLSKEDAKEFLDKFTKAIKEDAYTFPGSRSPPIANFANAKKERSEYESGRGGFSGGRGGFGGDRRQGGRSFGGRDQGRDRRGGGGGARDWINEDRGRFQSRGDDY